MKLLVLVLGVAACGGSPSSDLPSAQATQLALGISHACALTTAGSVRCWSENDQGQIGNGGALGFSDRHLPEQVLGLESGVTMISASSEGSFTTARSAMAGSPTPRATTSPRRRPSSA